MTERRVESARAVKTAAVDYGIVDKVVTDRAAGARPTG